MDDSAGDEVFGCGGRRVVVISGSGDRRILLTSDAWCVQSVCMVG